MYYIVYIAPTRVFQYASDTAHNLPLCEHPSRFNQISDLIQ